MLESNTDRIIWVVGAIAIFGVLLAAMKLLFPGIFGTLGTQITGMITEAIQSVKVK